MFTYHELCFLRQALGILRARQEELLQQEPMFAEDLQNFIRDTPEARADLVRICKEGREADFAITGALMEKLKQLQHAVI